MKSRRIAAAAAAALVAFEAAVLSAQEPSGRPGWTFTPSFGFVETYDDNIALFAGPAANESADSITAYVPGANLTFVSRRTRASGGYSGSFLNYRNFSVFNRWDQRAEVSLHRQESARIDWSVSGSLTKRPSTESLDFDGIPYSQTAATALSGRAVLGYRFSARDAVSFTGIRQKVSFERPGELLPFLRGGESAEGLGSYRHRLDGRLAVGGNYAVRRATTTGEPLPLWFHMMRGAVDYDLTPQWKMSAGAGFDHLMATAETEGQSAPAYAISLERAAAGRRFAVSYQRLFMPSFGFGGAVHSQELLASYHTPLFHSRRFYTDVTASLRDNQPVIPAPGRLPLRSFRSTGILGWSPRPWVQVEGFYSRAMQSTGSRIERNRIGVQILTSAPMRVQ